jgi:hypothetical protein
MAPPPQREPVRIPDGEDPGPIERLEDRRNVRALGGRHEHDLRVTRVVHAGDSVDLDRASPDRLARHRLVEHGAEGIAAEDRDHEGRAGIVPVSAGHSTNRAKL